jgi:hypothetical protein
MLYGNQKTTTMKKQFFLASAVAMLLMAACNNSETTNANADTTVTTKTTTTTTTTKYAKRNLENRKLVDLKTNKEIVLVYDTVHYYYVDAATNQVPTTYYYYDPSTNDTFDYRGYILNNSLRLKDGEYFVDEVKLMENPYNLEVKSDLKATPVDIKTKDNGNAYKEKTDTSKIKITDRKTKIKIKKPKEE